MPAPRPNPHADEVHADAGNQPDVICFLNRVPKFVQLQAAQGEPDEEDADEYAKPEMPFFHAADFITGVGGLSAGEAGLPSRKSVGTM
jgi:hypothetical protein